MCNPSQNINFYNKLAFKDQPLQRHKPKETVHMRKLQPVALPGQLHILCCFCLPEPLLWTVVVKHTSVLPPSHEVCAIMLWLFGTNSYFKTVFGLNSQEYFESRSIFRLLDTIYPPFYGSLVNVSVDSYLLRQLSLPLPFRRPHVLRFEIVPP